MKMYVDGILVAVGDISFKNKESGDLVPYFENFIQTEDESGVKSVLVLNSSGNYAHLINSDVIGKVDLTQAQDTGRKTLYKIKITEMFKGSMEIQTKLS